MRQTDFTHVRPDMMHLEGHNIVFVLPTKNVYPIIKPSILKISNKRKLRDILQNSLTMCFKYTVIKDKKRLRKAFCLKQTKETWIFLSKMAK